MSLISIFMSTFPSHAQNMACFSGRARKNICLVFVSLNTLICDSYIYLDTYFLCLNFSYNQGKWEVPLPKVRSVSEAEAFKVVRTGKSKRKAWKRLVTKMCFVGDTFTRKPPKFERFIRPMGLRVKKANVTHPELKTTFQLPIIGVKKNPSSPMYTTLGVITKGTIIEVCSFIWYLFNGWLL